MTSSRLPTDDDAGRTLVGGAGRRGVSERNLGGSESRGGLDAATPSDGAEPRRPEKTPSASGSLGHASASAEASRGVSEVSPLFAMWKDMQGRTLGNFRLIQPIAAGGMGAVFFARKESFGGFSQPAAVKLVHPHFAGQKDFVDMFLDEARIASFVQHSNVCRVLDFGVDEGTYYLAMEYVYGETWGELAARATAADDMRDVLPEIAAYVLSQACEGLHAAHVATGEEGRPLHIVHRDVSPQNLFVAYDGTVRVLDFGVARASERLTTTRAGVVKGKLAYMSPEQVSGGVLDGRVDVWALGVILREALENKRLFRRENDTETLRAVVNEPLPEWSVQVPCELKDIVERALARDLSVRFATAREMGLALSRFTASRAAPIGAPALSGYMNRLFAEQLQQKRALFHVEATPKPETPGSSSKKLAREPNAEARGSVSSEATSREGAGSGQGAAYNPEDATRMAAVRRQSNSLLSVPPLLSLRSARIQRRLGAGLVGLGVLVLVLAAMLLFKRAGQEPDVPTVTLVRPPEAPTGGALRTTGMAIQRPTEQDVRPEIAPAEPAPSADLPAGEEASSNGPGSDVSKLPASRSRRGLTTLRVASPSGWAEVYLEGRLLGTTPGIFKLRGGTHTLLIKPSGKGPGYRRTVKLVSGVANKLIL